MTYRIQTGSSFERETRRLPRQHLRRIAKCIRDLSADPYPPQHVVLSGAHGVCLVRVGDYRVIYQVLESEKVVKIARVGKRDDAYKALSDLLKRLGQP